MKYLSLIAFLFLSIQLNAQRYDHIELSLRAGLSQNSTFFPDDYSIADLTFTGSRPEGFTNTQRSLSGELSVNWIKRNLDATTRWALGFKAGIIPFAIKWYPNEDGSFYSSSIGAESKKYGERFNVGSHFFTGVTGGMRSRIFTIKKVRMDIVMDLGLIYGFSNGTSLGYNTIDDMGNSEKNWQVESEINPTSKDIGDIFVDFRFGYMVNFPIKERNVGIGFSGTVSPHFAMESQMEYFGKDESVKASAMIQHVIFALELKYDLISTPSQGN